MQIPGLRVRGTEFLSLDGETEKLLYHQVSRVILLFSRDPRL